MGTIKVNDKMLYFTHPMRVASGPVLLLIHGAGGTHLDWPKEIQRLPGTNVYNLDLPGHGRSEGPGRSTIDGYADDVQAFMEGMALQNVTVAGHSMGGAITQVMALRAPTQLSKIVVVSSSARLRVSSSILDVSLTNPEMAVDFVINASWGSQAADALASRGRETMLQIDPVVLHGDFVACNDFDIRNRLNQIHIPTLIISGTEDMMTPLKHGRYLAENIADARLFVVEGAGHFSMLENPKLVAGTISEFLGLDE